MTGSIDTLRTIFDEYTLESDCLYFIQIKGKAIPEETETKNLVSYPDGPIHAKDSGEGVLYSKYHKYVKILQMKQCSQLMDPKGGLSTSILSSNICLCRYPDAT